jgi:MFS family permease
VRALRHRDFRLLLLGSTLVSMVMPLQFLTQIFWVQSRYPERSVLYVGLIAASRGAAMLAFSLIGGAFADRFERRRVLFACESAAVSINAVIAVLMLTNPFGEATMAALLVLTFLAAGNMAIDMPARTASMPAIVGMGDLANAISLNMIFVQLSFPLMLPLTGLLNSAFEPGKVYAGSLVVWAGVLPLIAALRYRSTGAADRSRGMLGNIRDGLAYTRRDAAIFAVISIITVMQVVGMPGVATLGPVWMTEVLKLSKSQFGFMAMTWGLGALVASFFFAHQHALTRRGTTLCVTVIAFSLAAIVFGHSRNIPITAVANFVLGFCMVGTMVTASTVVQHVVSDDMRGRVMGLFPLAMGLQMLNAAPVSAAGQVFGLEVVVPALGWATLALCAAIIVVAPALRRLQPGMEPEPAGEPVADGVPAGLPQPAATGID